MSSPTILDVESTSNVEPCPIASRLRPKRHQTAGQYDLEPVSDGSDENEADDSDLENNESDEINHNGSENSDDLFRFNTPGDFCVNNGQPQQPQLPVGEVKRKRRITRDQRLAANRRERKRMTSLNTAFERLKKSVPVFPHERKLSRIQTLRLAMSYISFMSDLLWENPCPKPMVPATPVHHQQYRGHHHTAHHHQTLPSMHFGMSTTGHHHPSHYSFGPPAQLGQHHHHQHISQHHHQMAPQRDVNSLYMSGY